MQSKYLSFAIVASQGITSAQVILTCPGGGDNLYFPIVLGELAGISGNSNKSTTTTSDEIAYADFNGDGCPDLAIGAPGEAIGDVADAGLVNVLYGSAAGLSAANNQTWQQDTPGVGGAAEAGDGFGRSLTARN